MVNLYQGRTFRTSNFKFVILQAINADFFLGPGYVQYKPSTCIAVG